MREVYGQTIFDDGCPVCKELCCCANKTIHCDRKIHCYRKCPASRNASKQNSTVTAAAAAAAAAPAAGGIISFQQQQAWNSMYPGYQAALHNPLPGHPLYSYGGSSSSGANSSSSSGNAAGIAGVPYLGVAGAGAGGYALPPGYGFVHPGMAGIPAGNLYLQALLHANMSARQPQPYLAQGYPPQAYAMGGHDQSSTYNYGQPPPSRQGMPVGAFPTFPFPAIFHPPPLQTASSTNEVVELDQWGGQQRHAPDSSADAPPPNPLAKKARREEACASPTSAPGKDE